MLSCVRGIVNNFGLWKYAAAAENSSEIEFIFGTDSAVTNERTSALRHSMFTGEQKANYEMDNTVPDPAEG